MKTNPSQNRVKYWNEFHTTNIFILLLLNLQIRGVQNRINSIEKSQTEPIQNKNRKNRILFECIQTIFLLNCMVWFGLRFLF